MVPLGQAVLDARSGYSSGSHNESGRGLPHLRPMNISRQGELDFGQVKYVPPNVSDLRLANGDVVFNNTNSRELVGKSAVFNLDEEWGFSNHITRLRPSPEFLPEFIALQLQYLWEAEYFQAQAKQHVNQASISLNALINGAPMLHAPLQDQERVVAELSRTWATLALVRQTARNAKEQLSRIEDQTILDAAEGRLVPTEKQLAEIDGRAFTSGEELLTRIRTDRLSTLISESRRRNATYSRASPEDQDDVPPPLGWAYARVDDVGEVTLGKKREPSVHSGPHMRPYLRVANVQENHIDVSDILRMNISPDQYEVYRLQYSDILLNEGQSPELVGRAAMYRDELPGACFQMTLLRFRAYDGVSPTFALLIFRAFLRNGKFKNAARWTTNIAHLSTRRFAAMSFPLPPLEEQERIVEEAERRLAIIGALDSTFASIDERTERARFVDLASAFGGMASRPTAAAAARDIEDVPPEEPAIAEETLIVTGTEVRDQAGRRRLIDVIADSGRGLTPRELFDLAGFTDALVDDFYSELRDAVASGYISEQRDSSGVPALVPGEAAQ